MAALGTSGTGEAVGEDAALEILAKLPLDVGRYRTAIPVVFPCEGEIGLQLLLNDAVENRVLRTATRVRNGSTSLRRDGHVGVRTEARVRIDTVYMYSIAASLQLDPERRSVEPSSPTDGRRMGEAGRRRIEGKGYDLARQIARRFDSRRESA